MIKKEDVWKVVENEIENSDYFLVDITVGKGDKVRVEIDKDEGIRIQECAELSRAIVQHFDRDKEDFELEVSSPGMGKPFKILRQYEKNLGKKIEVLTKGGEKLKGALESFNETGIEINAEIKEKVEGKKKKQIVLKKKQLNFDEIKETKKVITFK